MGLSRRTIAVHSHSFSIQLHIPIQLPSTCASSRPSFPPRPSLPPSLPLRSTNSLLRALLLARPTLLRTTPQLPSSSARESPPTLTLSALSPLPQPVESSSGPPRSPSPTRPTTLSRSSREPPSTTPLSSLSLVALTRKTALSPLLSPLLMPLLRPLPHLLPHPPLLPSAVPLRAPSPA